MPPPICHLTPLPILLQAACIASGGLARRPQRWVGALQLPPVPPMATTLILPLDRFSNPKSWATFARRSPLTQTRRRDRSSVLCAGIMHSGLFLSPMLLMLLSLSYIRFSALSLFCTLFHTSVIFIIRYASYQKLLIIFLIAIF